MTDFNRLEIFNSYIFLRDTLGLTNKKKNDRFLVGIRYTGNMIFAINENGTTAILLLKQNEDTMNWFFLSPHPQLLPLADHIRRAIENSSNPLLSEPAFVALKEVLSFGD